jgi:hypothetical protein
MGIFLTTLPISIIEKLRHLCFASKVEYETSPDLRTKWKFPQSEREMQVIVVCAIYFSIMMGIFWFFQCDFEINHNSAAPFYRVVPEAKCVSNFSGLHVNLQVTQNRNPLELKYARAQNLNI